jgi:hypothetical protein
VEFVGIGLLDSKENSLGFVRRHNLTFPNGYDGNGRIARAYGFVYQPWWAVITKDGMLLRAGRGPASEEELASTIRTLVGR